MARAFQASVIFLVLCGCSEDRATHSESPLYGSQHGKSKVETDAEQHAVVELTPTAIARLRDAQRQDGRPFLRVSVVSGGSTGFMYDLKFDDQCSVEKDYVDEVDGIRIVVDKRSALFLEGATIDWQTRSDGQEGFHFDNPNAIE